jgi:hypothetical protein
MPPTTLPLIVLCPKLRKFATAPEPKFQVAMLDLVAQPDWLANLLSFGK